MDETRLRSANSSRCLTALGRAAPRISTLISRCIRGAYLAEAQEHSGIAEEDRSDVCLRDGYVTVIILEVLHVLGLAVAAMCKRV